MNPPEKDELTRIYCEASDQVLMETALSYDSLTEGAQAALRSEFTRRGLEPPEIPAPPVVAWQRLVTVRQYRDLAEAQIAKGVLDSAGIPSSLRDENTVRMEWVWSNLLGGVRLQVAENDREAAESILEQPFPALIETGGEPAYEQPKCPRCGSLDIHYQAIHERFGMASILVFIPLPIPKHAWRCNSCSAEWREVPG